MNHIKLSEEYLKLKNQGNNVEIDSNYNLVVNSKSSSNINNIKNKIDYTTLLKNSVNKHLYEILTKKGLNIIDYTINNKNNIIREEEVVFDTSSEILTDEDNIVESDNELDEESSSSDSVISEIEEDDEFSE